MNRLAAAGTAFIILGFAGYAVGTAVAFPGRAFSVTSVMVGITLIAIRRADDEVAP